MTRMLTGRAPDCPDRRNNEVRTVKFQAVRANPSKTWRCAGIREAILLSTALVLIAPSAFAQSDTVVAYRHDGAIDPLGPTEGWLVSPGDATIPGALGNGATTVEVGAVMPDSNCRLSGICAVDAWVVDDRSTTSGSRYRYEQSPTIQEVDDAFAVGWTLRGYLRVSSGEDADLATEVDPVDASVIIEYSEGVDGGGQRYGMLFGVDANGFVNVSLLGDGRTYATTVTSDEYLDYELVYVPADGDASLYVNGRRVLIAYAGIPSAGGRPPGQLGQRVELGARAGALLEGRVADRLRNL